MKGSRTLEEDGCISMITEAQTESSSQLLRKHTKNVSQQETNGYQEKI